MAGEYYQQFIKETFVDPIRSILIVDDDYPTYDEILSSRTNSDQAPNENSEKTWKNNPESIREVIRKFRLNDPPLLVDIHDGKNVTATDEKKIVTHLHQSDLLILDYQLEKSKKGDGTLAIEILRDLMSNDHFNLVIVYTIEPLDIVFDEVRWGLLSPTTVDRLSDEEKREVENLFETTTDESWLEFFDQASKSIESEHYFYSRIHESTYSQTMIKGQQPYSEFLGQCKRAGLESREIQKRILHYFLQEVETRNLSKMNKSNNELKWSANSIRWIRSESVFICFSNKSSDDDLLEELQVALKNWNPDPSRLFLAKLRAVMDSHGVVAEKQVLSNKHALAYWYQQLLRAKKPELDWLVVESVSHHSDQLMEEVLTHVGDFAKRLISAEISNGDIEKKCLDHFKVDFGKEQNRSIAAKEHNAYVCSKSPSGWHLTTGHIFTMCNDYWLCLSPACDLVPAQLSQWQKETFGDHLPFVAIRLHEKSNRPQNIQSNRYLFLKLDNNIRVFSFSSDVNSAPNWDILYAANEGQFVSDFDFTVWRNKLVETNKSNVNFVLTSCSAKVVSQLRHQYAFNLVQKFGTSLTRVGLNFAIEF